MRAIAARDSGSRDARIALALGNDSPQIFCGGLLHGFRVSHGAARAQMPVARVLSAVHQPTMSVWAFVIWQYFAAPT
jgi:hypothetical protein